MNENISNLITSNFSKRFNISDTLPHADDCHELLQYFLCNLGVDYESRNIPQSICDLLSNREVASANFDVITGVAASDERYTLFVGVWRDRIREALSEVFNWEET